jgi:glyoxylase-like metal-dependent hydrolase (beta-lactamase superfamily II)
VEIEVVVTPGLGDNSYLIASDGEAAIVDPQRDAGRLLDIARRKGLSVRTVLETHVHNDYVSGALEISRATRAEIAAPALGRYGFPTRPMSDGDEVVIGGLRLRAMETPGHTPEHLSYVLFEDGSEVATAVFTGGSLMVGGAGRTDLLGPALADELTRAQYRTLRKLAELPGEVRVLPTHGAGSFCGAGPAPKERTSTIAVERVRNRALSAPDEETFVRQQLSGLLDYPAYYRFMAPINRSGPSLLADLARPVPLTPDEVEERIRTGAWVADARSRFPFARAHIPGSLNVELDDAFASYVGWLVPFNDPLVLVLPDPLEETLKEAITQLRRVGFERTLGYLAGGVEAWASSGRSQESYGMAGLEEFCREYRAGRAKTILDVRQQTEWDRGHIPNSRHIFIGDLPGLLEEVPRDGEVWAICATGHRSSMAGSLLAREGIPVRVVEGTGVPDFLAHCVEP